MTSEAMVSVRKRLSSSPPKKSHQVDITSFTSKRPDNKSSPRRSYAQALVDNPYDALSENDDEDEEMVDAVSCNSSEDTQRTDNAQVSQSPTSESGEVYQPPRSKKE